MIRNALVLGVLKFSSFEYPKVPHESCMNLVDTDGYATLGHPGFMFGIANVANQHVSDMASP